MSDRNATCYECGEAISKPAVTVHRGTADNLRFCSSICHTDWSFENALELLKRDIKEMGDQ